MWNTLSGEQELYYLYTKQKVSDYFYPEATAHLSRALLFKYGINKFSHDIALITVVVISVS